MAWTVATAGVTLGIDSQLTWVEALLREAVAGSESPTGAGGEPDLVVTVERTTDPFPTGGLQVLSREASCRPGVVLLRSAASSGFDLLLDVRPRPAELTVRWRPERREVVLHRALRSRFHLLARAALLQYPALWWTSTLGRAPLHVSGIDLDGAAPLLAGPGGVGKSTLLAAAMEQGHRAVSDNLAASDGSTVWGLVEPLRVEGGNGRAMPHGRHERPFPHRLEAFTPDRIILPRRSRPGSPKFGDDLQRLEPISSEIAHHSLVAGTYAAGELRRYWAYAALLSAGTGAGPVHPDVDGVARQLTDSLPCFALRLGDPGMGLEHLLPAGGSAGLPA